MADTGRNSQLQRLIELVRDLDRLGGSTLDELAVRHRVTTRTIRRDLEALEAAGIEVRVERDGRTYRRHADFKGPIRDLTRMLDRNHYLALTLAMGQGGAARSSVTALAHLEDLAGKIENALPASDRARLRAIAAAVLPRERFAWQNDPPDVVWPLVDAIAERRLCTVRYRAARRDAEARAYTVLPLKIFCHDGAAYLQCHVPKHDNVITLNLHRLEDLRVLTETADAPRDYHPDAHERAAFGVTSGGELEEWCARFSPDAAPFIRERAWHPTQVLTDLPDGGVELRFSCERSPEVFAWVCSWHGEVEVLRPERVRAELLALGRQLSTRYATHPGG